MTFDEADRGAEPRAGSSLLSPFALGILMRRAHEKMAEASDAVLRPFGIERRHLMVLMKLQSSGPLTQRDLVITTNHDKASIVRIVDDLERLGLASRELVAGDRRLRAVTMTDHGRDVYVRAHRAADAAVAETTAPLTSAQVHRLASLLQLYTGGAPAD